MRALVTGAAGFIGSALTDRLLAIGHRVLAVDDLSTGRLSNLDQAWADPSFTFVECDVADPSCHVEMGRFAPEVVFHLAAQMDVRHSVADPLNDARRNVLGTINVLEAARHGGTRKVVFASSGGSVYGDQDQLPVPESAPVDPHAPYAASKVCGEVYLGVYRRLYGLDSTALRLGNVYGPRQDPQGEAGVVAIFAMALLRGSPTAIFGDGSTTRDYVHVDDVVDAFVASGEPAGSGRCLNIGSGQETSVRDLHRLLAEVIGCPDQPRLLPPRAGELGRVALDCDAARRVLGWRPRIDLVSGLSATVSWLRDDASLIQPARRNE
jgi:UDP-glucose 4-epimerase